MRRSRASSFVIAGVLIAVPVAASATVNRAAQASTASVAPAAGPFTGWQTSSDRAVTLDGDATGLHVLVADAKQAYRWRTAATLSEPGVETDEWIGQACVTASGRRAVVVYGPRQMVNREDLFDSGALVAVVDLDSGQVTKLDQRVSIAYFNPGCGGGESVALTRRESVTGTTEARTTVLLLDAASGTIAHSMSVTGQLASAVPYGSSVAAVKGQDLVSVDTASRVRVLAAEVGRPFRTAVAADGGLAFEVVAGSTTALHRYAAGVDSVVTTTAAGTVQIRGSAGRVFVLGVHASALGPVLRTVPSWSTVDAPAGSDVSSQGELVITSSSSGQEAAGRHDQTPAPDTVQPIAIKATITSTGAASSTVVLPRPVRPGEGRAPSPALSSGVGPTARPAAQVAAVTDPSTLTTDPDRACAIARNDPAIQTLQPSPAMAEWAVDRAILGKLTVSRAANWHKSGLPAYTPQGLFPNHALTGGGHVPAQVMLGILAQESNMWQASDHAIDGETGNFEQGGFYGNNGSIHTVNWAAADCGYGMAQVTDGMAIGSTTYTANQQLALTVDYAANVAAGLQILEDKWNQTKAAGMTLNGGDPQYLENWWYAIWAYNSGFHAVGSDTTGQWGVGWSNNPINPDFPADRLMFLSGSRDDAKVPSHWSYPERVMGWASSGLLRYDFVNSAYVNAFTLAHWPLPAATAQPPHATFCTVAGDQCDTTKPHQPAQYPTEPPGACQRDDLKCWWHLPASWVTCSSLCGTEVIKYSATSAEPSVTTIYPEKCASTLPSTAIIVDDVGASVPPALTCPDTKNWTSKGALTFSFGSKVNGTATVYPAKIDFHQLGSGFGGHFWFTHTESASATDVKVTGTWKPTTRLTGWDRVMVHIPDNGAQTQQAHYQIHLGNGVVEDRIIPTDIQKDTWVSLGVFHFVAGSDTTSVSLSNVTTDATGEADVAWDAAAFIPLAAKPKNFVVAMGDSYSSGEGAGGYETQSDLNYGNVDWEACRRSTSSWPRKAVLPGLTQSTGALADSLDASVDFHSVACSGALTRNVGDSTPLGYWSSPGTDLVNMWDTASGQFREINQVGSGFLDANTTLVTLSLGGNDAGFVGLVEDCALPTNCANAGNEAADQAKINSVQFDIRTRLEQIQAAAPNAQIILMGYPRLISPTVKCASSADIDISEGDMMNRLSDYMASAEQGTANIELAAGLKVHFANPVGLFGGHGVCDPAAWINGVVFGPNGAGDNPTIDLQNSNTNCAVFETVCASRESFHPNGAGTTGYAQVLNAALVSIGYHGTAAG